MPDHDSSTSYTVLVVEDDQKVAAAFRRMISGYSQKHVAPVMADTLANAVKILDTQSFDMILWDGDLGDAPITETVKVIARFRHRAQIHVATSTHKDAKELMVDSGLCQEFASKPDGAVNFIRTFFQARYPKEMKA